MKLLWVALAAGLLSYAFAAAGDDVKTLPDGAGKETVGRVCTGCHATENFRKKRLGEDEWTDEVAQMIDQGAKASDQEQTVIVRYLVQNFGKDSKIWINTAPFPELKSVLGMTNEEAQAVIAYRQQHGNFKEFSEVAAVPGVDAKKLEAKKDLLAF